MKDFNKSKIIKVKCSFCGKDIECPEEMLKTSKKHMCYECFQKSDTLKLDKDLKNVHVDMPMDEFTDIAVDNFTQMVVNDVFPKIWSEKKEELKEFSKKDLSKEMFGAGVYLGIQAFLDSMQELEKNEKTEKDK
jgi:hypothetical protein